MTTSPLAANTPMELSMEVMAMTSLMDLEPVASNAFMEIKVQT